MGADRRTDGRNFKMNRPGPKAMHSRTGRCLSPCVSAPQQGAFLVSEDQTSTTFKAVQGCRRLLHSDASRLTTLTASAIPP